MAMMNILFIGTGGFLGAVARYSVGELVKRHANISFPAGTLIVNVAGCFLIGFIMSLLGSQKTSVSYITEFAVIGFIGSFTTFSAFGYDTLLLFQSGDTKKAILNIALNLIICLAAVWAGKSFFNFICSEA